MRTVCEQQPLPFNQPEVEDLPLPIVWGLLRAIILRLAFSVPAPANLISRHFLAYIAYIDISSTKLFMCADGDCELHSARHCLRARLITSCMHWSP